MNFKLAHYNMLCVQDLLYLSFEKSNIHLIFQNTLQLNTYYTTILYINLY